MNQGTPAALRDPVSKNKLESNCTHLAPTCTYMYTQTWLAYNTHTDTHTPEKRRRRDRWKERRKKRKGCSERHPSCLGRDEARFGSVVCPQTTLPMFSAYIIFFFILRSGLIEIKTFPWDTASLGQELTSLQRASSLSTPSQDSCQSQSLWIESW